MNHKIKDVQSEVSLQVVRAREELFCLRMELAGCLPAMGDVKRVSPIVRDILQSEVREAYEDLITKIQEAAG